LVGAAAAAIFTAVEGMVFLLLDDREHEGAQLDLVKVEIMAALLAIPCFAILGFFSSPSRENFLRNSGVAGLLLALILVRLHPLGAQSAFFLSLLLVIAALLTWGAFRLNGLVFRAPKWAFCYALTTYLSAHLIIGLGANFQAQEHDFPDHLTAQTERPPSVILVVIDTLRADHLGAYGYRQPTSPVIDQLAAAGTLFQNAWAQAPWTRPSTASLMTGLYPSSHQSNNQNQAIGPDLPMISTMLRRRGYRTAAFSANPQVSPLFGFDRGFDLFWNVESYALSHYLAFGQVFAWLRQRLPLDAWMANFLRRSDTQAQDSRPGTDAAAVNQRVFRWMDDYEPETAVFLYIHYIDPHDPYDPPQDLLHVKPITGRAGQEIVVRSFQAEPYPYFSFPEPDPAKLRDVLASYDAEIRYVDTQLGRLIERLQQKGILTDRDYLIVTADHGEEFYDHGQWLHGRSLFEEVLHVPLIIQGPGVVQQVIDAPVQLVDIFPTLAAATGEGLPATSMHGWDLQSVLTGEADLRPRTLFAERPSDSWHLYATRSGNSKLIHAQNQAQELWLQYDLTLDPSEQNDLAHGQDPGIAGQETRRQIRAASLLRASIEATEVEVDRATLQALRKLGYLDPVDDSTSYSPPEKE
jgi:arylsulfatase A-like enzyme